MDGQIIASIVIAIVAIIPGTWALINQAKKDSQQSKLDMTNAAQAAAVGIIAPLQAEVSRLQTRVMELEKALIDKTAEIGRLMQEGIDKDVKIRTLEYTMEGMKYKLEEFEKKRKISKTKVEDITENGAVVVSSSSPIDDEIKAAEIKKEEIKMFTDKQIKELTSKSLNGHLKESENIGE